MKVILNEKINKLGNIGDVVEVATGYARNFLFPNNKAIRFSAANIAKFEAVKAELQAKQDAAKKSAEGLVAAVQAAKLYMIRQAGDTGHLYGSVTARDVARMLTDAGVAVASAQVLMGSPIKTVGTFETKIALHADVIVPVKIYVAQTQDEINELVAGKVLTFGNARVMGTNPGETKNEKRETKDENESDENAIEQIAEEVIEEAEQVAEKVIEVAEEIAPEIAEIATEVM